MFAFGTSVRSLREEVETDLHGVRLSVSRNDRRQAVRFNLADSTEVTNNEAFVRQLQIISAKKDLP